MKTFRSRPSYKKIGSSRSSSPLRRTKSFARSIEQLESRALLDGDAFISQFQNQYNHLDVNGDGRVAPLDALIIINELSTAGSHQLTSAASGNGNTPASPLFLDVNGDRFVSPQDALRVMDVLNAVGDPKVQFRLQTTDLDGNPIAVVPAGTDFLLQVYVKDIRPGAEATGVFAAYLDVTYTTGNVSIDPGPPPSIVSFYSPYTQATHEDTFQDGLVDDTGAYAPSLTRLGPAERLVWSVPVHANNPGSVTFDGDGPDDPTRAVVIYDSNQAVMESELVFVPSTIIITSGIVPTIAIDDVTVPENIASGNATFTVSLSAASTDEIRVAYATANGTAAAPNDYTARSGILTFAPGETTKTIIVPIIDDALPEAPETFLVNLSNSTNAIISDPQGTGFINDNEVAVLLTINDVTVTEGNTPPVSAAFTVTLSAVQAVPVIVGYATQDDTATDGADYVGQSGILTFAPGETQKTVTVPIVPDLADELDETFFVNLSSSVGAVIGDSQGIGTITDDDQEGLRISDVNVVEGDSGTTDARFTVSLSNILNRPFTVTYATEDVTATDADNDYEPQTGTITFNAGEQFKTITVLVNGDLLVEPNETFNLNLIDSTGPDIIDGQAIATIFDDDTPGGDLAQVRLELTQNGSVVTSISPSEEFVLTVYVQDLRDPALREGIAAAYFDVLYDSNLVDVIDVIQFNGPYNNATSGDTSQPNVLDEVGAFDGLVPLGPAEQILFSVRLQAINAGRAVFTADPADANGHNVLLYGSDDPVAPNQVIYGTAAVDIGNNSLSISNVTIVEGDSGTKDAIFTVTRFLPTTATATVVYSTANGTATTPLDYLSTGGTLTFAPGSNSQTITVKIVGDLIDEDDETFFVNLSGAVNATVSDAQGLGTIVDDDVPPQIFVTDVTGSEGDILNFKVSLSSPSGKPITVTFATANDTALAGQDYNATNGVLTFAPGETEMIVPVTTRVDLLQEPPETFFLNLGSPNNATLGDAQGIGTILNAVPSGVTGFVYVDVDGDGFKDPNEQGIEGVTIRLTQPGTSLSLTTLTLSDGSYSFVGLPPGTYTVTEVQPGFYFDGLDTPGTPPPTEPPLDDQFNGIVLTSGVLARNYNFGEQGLRPEFANAFFNRRAFFASSIFTHEYGPVSRITNLDLKGGDVWIAFDGGWQGQKNIEAFFQSSQGSVVLRLYDYDLNLLATSATETDHAVIRYVGTPGVTYFLRVSGTNSDVSILVTETLSASSVTVTEPNAGTVDAVFTVSLSGLVMAPVTVRYTAISNTATAAADFNSVSGTLTFNPGVLSQTVTVQVRGDLIDELNETFFLNLSGPNNAALAVSQGVGTIIDNDPTPTMTIGNITVTEPGTTGTVSAVFPVTLSAASGKVITVKYSTANGTAVAPNDYAPVLGTLTFAPGVTTQSITVPVKGDNTVENNETFFVSLTGATNTVVSGGGTGTGTIINFVPAPIVFGSSAPSGTLAVVSSPAPSTTSGSTAASSPPAATSGIVGPATRLSPTGTRGRVAAVDSVLAQDQDWFESLLS